MFPLESHIPIIMKSPLYPKPILPIYPMKHLQAKFQLYLIIQPTVYSY